MAEAVENASERIDQYIVDTGDWRGATLSAVRRAVLAADPGIVEEWKWMGSPAWLCDGMIAVGDAHKKKVKVTFAYGARLDDPAGLFNGDDKGATRRSIDLFEGDIVDEAGLTALVRSAIAYNRTNLKKNAGKAAKKKAASAA
ncbi:MAG: DUF1801 domain-containing protein [Hyphomicrobiaceae bacterium]|nr:DUF1801 domain-containing protein [Hyphomicrobiaceae bacterium]